MGAWGTGNWDNDDALDWIGELGEARDLERVLTGPGTDTGMCCRALAAAGVIAAALGRPGDGVPDEVKSWLEFHGRECPPSLAGTALVAGWPRSVPAPLDIRRS
ncbi:MAG: DUF4259 domain-containing protein [Deltaproteobacteria bacterium]|nr:DUF4259 domain-containing protein [Deltaproteobacteria bacterium]